VDSKPLEYFKDWSNYLLVTTVAALGWVATNNVTFANPWLRVLCIAYLALSVVFGIFTLALIPLVAEQRSAEKSFYDVEATFTLFGRQRTRKLKWACFPQHVFFILGIVEYAVGIAWKG
jgi:predicted kinase